jgi:hypothetical protein
VIDDTNMARRNDISVKLDPRVYRYAKTLAAWEGMRLAEFISLAVAEVVEKKWKEEHGDKLNLVRDLQAEIKKGDEE